MARAYRADGKDSILESEGNGRKSGKGDHSEGVGSADDREGSADTVVAHQFVLEELAEEALDDDVRDEDPYDDGRGDDDDPQDQALQVAARHVEQDVPPGERERDQGEERHEQHEHDPVLLPLEPDEGAVHVVAPDHQQEADHGDEEERRHDRGAVAAVLVGAVLAVVDGDDRQVGAGRVAVVVDSGRRVLLAEVGLVGGVVVVLVGTQLAVEERGLFQVDGVLEAVARFGERYHVVMGVVTVAKARGRPEDRDFGYRPVCFFFTY